MYFDLLEWDRKICLALNFESLSCKTDYTLSSLFYNIIPFVLPQSISQPFYPTYSAYSVLIIDLGLNGVSLD